jgi:hypothetical protein
MNLCDYNNFIGLLSNPKMQIILNTLGSEKKHHAREWAFNF